MKWKVESIYFRTNSSGLHSHWLHLNNYNNFNSFSNTKHRKGQIIFQNVNEQHLQPTCSPSWSATLKTVVKYMIMPPHEYPLLMALIINGFVFILSTVRGWAIRPHCVSLERVSFLKDIIKHQLMVMVLLHKRFGWVFN